MKIVDPWNQAVSFLFSRASKNIKQPQLQVAAYVVIQLGEGTQRQGNKESAGGPQILYLGWRGWSNFLVDFSPKSEGSQENAP